MEEEKREIADRKVRHITVELRMLQAVYRITGRTARLLSVVRFSGSLVGASWRAFFGRRSRPKRQFLNTDLANSLGTTDEALSAALGFDTVELYLLDRVTRDTRLTDLNEIINRVEPWEGSKAAAFTWFRSKPLPSFGDQTAEDLVKAGRGEAVKRYLARVAVGGYA